jgi:hypothetical protein
MGDAVSLVRLSHVAQLHVHGVFAFSDLADARWEVG